MLKKVCVVGNNWNIFYLKEIACFHADNDILGNIKQKYRAQQAQPFFKVAGHLLVRRPTHLCFFVHKKFFSSVVGLVGVGEDICLSQI